MSDEVFDVIVVGAGLAGAAVAAVLGRWAIRVAIVDPQPECRPVFKAEKIEPDQTELFQRLGLLDQVRPHAAPIHTVTAAHFGWRLGTHTHEHFGVRYHDLVNAVRRQIPVSVQQHTARLAGLETGPEIQSVSLSTGGRLTARLVVVATGTGGGQHLQQLIGVEHHLIRRFHSLCSGFDIAPEHGQTLGFESLTYWSDRVAEAIDYITFFPVPGAFRVNLFSYRDPADPWVHSLAQDPVATLDRSIPRLRHVTKPWRAVSKVETRPIDLYTTRNAPRPGLVLVGDAYQSVCPATGTGLSKVLTDVERLCHVHVPAWLKTPGMGLEKTALYYADAEKLASDHKSLDWAEHRRHASTNPSFRWWLHRQKAMAQVALAGWFRSAQ